MLVRLLYICAVFIITFRNRVYAECEFGEIKFQKENDKEEMLKHYFSHKFSWANHWNNLKRARFLDPVCNLLTSKKQSLCECVYEKLYDETIAEKHDLNPDHNRMTRCRFNTIIDKNMNGAGSATFATCKVNRKTFFLTQGYQSYENRNDHDVYVFVPEEKTTFLRAGGLIEKLDFSRIDGDTSYYDKLRLHIANANSIHQHE